MIGLEGFPPLGYGEHPPLGHDGDRSEVARRSEAAVLKVACALVTS